MKKKYYLVSEVGDLDELSYLFIMVTNQDEQYPGNRLAEVLKERYGFKTKCIRTGGTVAVVEVVIEYENGRTEEYNLINFVGYDLTEKK